MPAGPRTEARRLVGEVDERRRPGGRWARRPGRAGAGLEPAASPTQFAFACADSADCSMFGMESGPADLVRLPTADPVDDTTGCVPSDPLRRRHSLDRRTLCIRG